GLHAALDTMRMVQRQSEEKEQHWRESWMSDWQGALDQWEGSLAQTRAEIDASDSSFDTLLDRLEQSASQVESLRASLRQQADGMQRMAGPAQQTLRESLLMPVFQIDAIESVGSGVLVWRGEDERGQYYLALSAQHVLRDLYGEEAGTSAAGATDASAARPSAVAHTEIDIPCVFDQILETPVRVTARLIAENVIADLALLEIRTDVDLGPVAKLASRDAEARISSFTPIWTVGCPLGTTAQATRGEVTRTDWKIGSQPYWMVSSPAFFGNSGGGVFLADSLELVGVFSKIYTHGSYRPQVVTHMGLAVPLGILHDWLAEVGYDFLDQNARVAETDANEAGAVNGALARD
ncbi:MAG: serine protease, partial [Planctomycetota bacterium]|nr:serine protease [Planctomycetota bacterium]